jgi:hypothetical protein
MWQATLKKAYPDPQFPNVSVSEIEFSDGSQTIVDTERGLDNSSLVSYCREKIAHLEAQASIDNYLANPPLGPVDTVPPQLTPDEMAQESLNQAIANLQIYQEQVNLGVIDQTDPDYQQALSDAKGAKMSLSSTLTAQSSGIKSL